MLTDTIPQGPHREAEAADAVSVHPLAPLPEATLTQPAKTPLVPPAVASTAVTFTL